MKTIKSLFILCLLSFGAYAQQNAKSLKVKLYNQSSYIKNESSYKANGILNFRTEKSSQIISPKFAIAYTNNAGNTHEIEINKFTIGLNNTEDRDSDSSNYNVIAGAETNIIDFSFRYEFTPHSKKDKLNNKGTFSVSYGVQPYFNYSNINPAISTVFPETLTNIGFLGYIAPRYMYQFSDKLYLDINIPFNLIETNYNAIVIDDPTKSKTERRTSSLNFNMLPMNYNLRIGLAYRI